MATFSAVQLRSGGSSANTTAVYTLRLNQMETILGRDHTLSPADYKQLADAATKFASSLSTPSERAAMLSRAEGYKQQVGSSSNTGIEMLTADIADESNINSLDNAGDPASYIANNVAVYTKAYNSLADQLDQAVLLDNAAATTITNKMNELKTQRDTWIKTQKAFTRGDSGAVTAYATTDENGNPMQIEYVPAGQSPKLVKGAKQTDVTLGGKIPLYVVPLSSDQSGIRAKFNGLDLSGNNPLPTIIKGADGQDIPVVTETKLSVVGRKDTGLVDVPLFQADPTTGQQVPTLSGRSYISKGEFVFGSDGKTIYQNVDGTNYKKYLNYSPDQVGANPSSMLRLPQIWENNLKSLVTDQVDAKQAPQPNGMPSLTAPPPLPVLNQTPESASQSIGPVQTAPDSAPLKVTPGGGQPGAIQQPQGAEKQQQTTQQISRGSFFSRFLGGK